VSVVVVENDADDNDDRDHDDHADDIRLLLDRLAHRNPEH